MAVATPAMLPTPTVAERAVMRAWKCEISPSASDSWYFLRKASLSAGMRVHI